MHALFKTVVGLVLVVICVMPAQPSTLDTLKPDHPRILAHAEDFNRVAELVKTDPLAAKWYARQKDRAEAMLDQPVAKYELRDGRRLLYVSREVLSRVMTLSLLHRIEPDPRYLDRVWADLEAAAGFKHWNPDHFLDVAEMGFAFALAYDWLYDQWSPAQRATIRQAIIRHAITPALKVYEDRSQHWIRTTSNWNQVCNGGLICAALAIANHKPELATQMIDLAVKALPISMKRYAPDGGYDEGPSYWSYGTSYNIYAIAALDSALGKDFGLSEMPGLDVTGSFPVQMTGPTDRVFNFADGSEKTPRSSALLYLAKRYNQPGYAKFAAKHNSGSPLDLLWYDPALIERDAAPMPLSVVYETVGVGAMRTAWGDPDAWYVAAKGGQVGTGHAQLDLGSFILESQGVRWLIDLGGDDYNLPGYFESGGMRWKYYRNRAEGHNTLVVNPSAIHGPDQSRTAEVKVIGGDQTLSMDLSEVYPGQVSREIAFDPANKGVRVIDRLGFDEPAEVWWFAHTRAAIDLADDGRSATLTQDGKRLRAKIISPTDARFEEMAASPMPRSPDPRGQNPNNGAKKVNTAGGSHFVLRGETPRFGKPDASRAIRKLAIQLTGVTDQQIEVVFENVK